MCFFLLFIVGPLPWAEMLPQWLRTRLRSGVQKKLAEGFCTSSNLQPNRDNQNGLQDSNPFIPQQPPAHAYMGSRSRRGSPPHRPRLVGWKSPRPPYLACSDHSRRKPGTESLAQSAEKEFLFARSMVGLGAAEATLPTLLAFPLVLRGAKWAAGSSPASRSGTGCGTGVASPWLRHYCKCSQYCKNL